MVHVKVVVGFVVGVVVWVAVVEVVVGVEVEDVFDMTTWYDEIEERDPLDEPLDFDARLLEVLNDEQK